MMNLLPSLGLYILPFTLLTTKLCACSLRIKSKAVVDALQLMCSTDALRTLLSTLVTIILLPVPGWPVKMIFSQLLTSVLTMSIDFSCDGRPTMICLSNSLLKSPSLGLYCFYSVQVPLTTFMLRSLSDLFEIWPPKYFLMNSRPAC